MSEPVLGYKVLGADGSCHHGGTGRWRKGRPRGIVGELAYPKGICYCSRDQLVSWLGPAIWSFEDLTPAESVNVCGETMTRRGVLVERFETWDNSAARLFAADCASDVVDLIPAADRYPFVAAIEAARGYADGLVDEAALAVAWSAAAASMAWSAAGWAACWAAWPPTWPPSQQAVGWVARAGAGVRADWTPSTSAGWASRMAAYWATKPTAGGMTREQQTRRLFSYLDGDAKRVIRKQRKASEGAESAAPRAADELDRLLELARSHATRPDSPIHGVDHWRRVGRNGERLAAATADCDARVVAVFAAFHDSQRTTDGRDPAHGARAAALCRRLGLGLSDEQLELLCAALVAHDRGGISADPTIGVCWDSDRLDLTRLGLRVNPALLSTAAGKEFV